MNKISSFIKKYKNKIAHAKAKRDQVIKEAVMARNIHNSKATKLEELNDDFNNLV